MIQLVYSNEIYYTKQQDLGCCVLFQHPNPTVLRSLSGRASCVVLELVLELSQLVVLGHLNIPAKTMQSAQDTVPATMAMGVSQIISGPTHSGPDFLY